MINYIRDDIFKSTQKFFSHFGRSGYENHFLLLYLLVFPSCFPAFVSISCDLASH